MKNKTIPVRVTDTEKAAIERQAQNCELSVSEFLREIGMMSWWKCENCGKLMELKYCRGFGGGATEPPEEGVYVGYCYQCERGTHVPEGEYHGK
jgi:hypothetical protein